MQVRTRARAPTSRRRECDPSRRGGGAPSGAADQGLIAAGSRPGGKPPRLIAAGNIAPTRTSSNKRNRERNGEDRVHTKYRAQEKNERGCAAESTRNRARSNCSRIASATSAGVFPSVSTSRSAHCAINGAPGVERSDDLVYAAHGRSGSDGGRPWTRRPRSVARASRARPSARRLRPCRSDRRAVFAARTTAPPPSASIALVVRGQFGDDLRSPDRETPARRRRRRSAAIDLPARCSISRVGIEPGPAQALGEQPATVLLPVPR